MIIASEKMLAALIEKGSRDIADQLFGRLGGEILERLEKMDARISALLDKEATLASTVDAVAATMTDIKTRLQAAQASNDWAGVDQVASNIDTINAKLAALVEPSAPIDPAA